MGLPGLGVKPAEVHGRHLREPSSSAKVPGAQGEQASVSRSAKDPGAHAVKLIVREVLVTNCWRFIDTPTGTLSDLGVAGAKQTIVVSVVDEEAFAGAVPNWHDAYLNQEEK